MILLKLKSVVLYAKITMAHRDSVKLGNPKMQFEDAFSGWLEEAIDQLVMKIIPCAKCHINNVD